MREIKFRVWDGLLKKYAVDTEDAHLYQQEDFCNGIFEVCVYSQDSVAEQYTGLKDKNGKEIYEGDIVKFRLKAFGAEEFVPLIVEFSFGCFVGRWPDDPKQASLPMEIEEWWKEDTYVAGNIHENKELLK